MTLEKLKQKAKAVLTSLTEIVADIVEATRVDTDKGLLVYEGDLEIGKDVSLEVDGVLGTAPDGDYLTEFKDLVTIYDGEITKVVNQDAVAMGEVDTDKGLLVYEGEIEVGKDVKLRQGEEDVVAPDGDYLTEYKDKISVQDGKVTNIVYQGVEELKSELKAVKAELSEMKKQSNNFITRAEYSKIVKSATEMSAIVVALSEQSIANPAHKEIEVHLDSTPILTGNAAFDKKVANLKRK